MQKTAATRNVMLIAAAGAAALIAGCKHKDAVPTPSPQAIIIGADPAATGHFPLLGKAAPSFEANQLDGTRFNLGDYLGKYVIVLDFWATWCGPCRMAMPIVDKVTGEFRNDGVMLFAVNAMEAPLTVREFVHRHNLGASVVLDQDGRASNLYYAWSLPTTVIIGPEGKVQAVHQGFSPDLESQLRHELQALVAGKDLTQ